MSFGPLLRFLVQPLDVGVELLAVDPPHPATSDLDRGQFTGPDERVHLRDADAQVGGHALISLMSSALVVAVWTVARERLVQIVTAALSNVCGGLGC